MVYWETAHTITDQPQFVLDFAGGREDHLLTDPSRAAQRTNAH
jgi:hypothetical protein